MRDCSFVRFVVVSPKYCFAVSHELRHLGSKCSRFLRVHEQVLNEMLVGIGMDEETTARVRAEEGSVRSNRVRLIVRALARAHPSSSDAVCACGGV